MKKKIHEAAIRTWEAIGGDCLRSLEEETGETSMPREEVIEAVILEIICLNRIQIFRI